MAASEATREGTVLGTPAYMSPEQARGQPVDRRADIWAFGCCLYECLSGRRRLQGRHGDRHARRRPRQGAGLERARRSRPASSPRRLLRRCLAKDVRRRLQHIGDARLDLEETGAETGRTRRRAIARSFRAIPALVIAAVLIATAAGVAFWLGAGRATTIGERAVTRLTLKLDDKTNGDLSFAACRVGQAVRDFTRRAADRPARTRWREVPTLSSRALRLRNATPSWHRGSKDALLLTRRPVDRILARRRSHSPESLGGRRFSDRARSYGRAARRGLGNGRRDRDTDRLSQGRAVVDSGRRR